MRLDIRLPLGLLFSIFGLLLLIFGLSSNQELYERSLGMNINCWWGTVLLLFGVVMFLLGRRNHQRLARAESSSKAASEHE